MESLAYVNEDFWSRLSVFNGFSYGGSSAKYCGKVHNDITIFSPTLDQHYEDVDCVLERLIVANYKVYVNKCAFACEEVIIMWYKASI